MPQAFYQMKGQNQTLNPLMKMRTVCLVVLSLLVVIGLVPIAIGYYIGGSPCAMKVFGWECFIGFVLMLLVCAFAGVRDEADKDGMIKW
jgi:hypothetical protein